MQAAINTENESHPCTAFIYNLNNDIFIHQVVVHEYNFMDTLDNTIHIQNMQQMWSHLKLTLKRICETSVNLLDSFEGIHVACK